MLGFVVSEKGKHLDPHRIIALLEAPQPRSKETLHALLSSFTFVRMFIPNFASIAAPLYEATKGIIWNNTDDRVLGKFRNDIEVSNISILAYKQSVLIIPLWNQMK